jgi:hypothetical protein
MGVGLLGWIAYNLFVELQPSAEGRSPLVPTLFALTITAIGIGRMRKGLALPTGERSDERSEGETP